MFGRAVCVWAVRLRAVERQARLSTLFAALALGGLGQFCQASLDVMPAAVLGVVYAAVVGVALIGRDPSPCPADLSASLPEAAGFKTLIGGFAVLAVVFGFVIGTSSQAQVGGEGPWFMRNVGLSLALCAAVLLAIKVFSGKPASLSGVMRFLAPAMAVLFLAHILFGGGLGGWLPCVTLGLWQVIELVAVLVLLDLNGPESGQDGSALPLGWGLICLGQGIGVFLGQVISMVLGASDGVVQVVTVVEAVAAVTGATLLAAGQYPAAGELGGASAAAPSAESPVPAPSADPVAEAISAIAAAHALSEREAQVIALLVSGNTRQGVAKKLVISENTVRVHVKNIYAKLGIHSKQQLADMVDKKASVSRDTKQP